MNLYPIRLRPDADLRRSLELVSAQNKLAAAFVVSIVGSLKRARLRMAGASEIISVEGPFEIFALSGTLCPDGAHLHIGLSDKTGACIGGHLCYGSVVYTTAEIVVGDSENHSFKRIHDQKTGYPELVIEARQPTQAKGPTSTPKKADESDPLESSESLPKSAPKPSDSKIEDEEHPF